MEIVNDNVKEKSGFKENNDTASILTSPKSHLKPSESFKWLINKEEYLNKNRLVDF